MMTNPYSKDAIEKTMPNKLRYFRERSHMTIYDVAEKLNKSGATISLWENGNTLPDIKTLLKMCDMYNITDINEFISDYIPPTMKSLTKSESTLVSLYRNTDKNIQKAILTILENIDSKKPNNI